jgi:23S rRNA (uracil1939-C5)-methyltransferase
MKQRKPAFRSQTIELDITSVGARGDGLAKWQGEQVFVPFTLAGEKVIAKLEGRRGDGLTANAVELLSAAPDRVEPPCPVFGRCGGCSLQHMAATSLAQWKRDRLVTALARVGVPSDKIAPLVSVPPGTRRRVSFAFLRRKQDLLFGFNERASNRLVEVDHCLLLAPPLLAIQPALRALLTACLDAGEAGDTMATLTDSGIDLVIRSDHKLDLFAREQLAAFADAHDLARLTWQSEPVAHRRPAQIMMGGIAVDLPPGGFLQPSREGEAALVKLVMDAMPARGAVADLYAGSGAFSFPLAAAGHAVHAVEGEPASIAALTAAARRGSLRITTEQRDLAQNPFIAESYAAVVFDPPRTGASAQAELLARSGPAVVVAVSCNPATLARDAALLMGGGYRLDIATPVDQFPWSAHLEAVAVFRR